MFSSWEGLGEEFHQVDLMNIKTDTQSWAGRNDDQGNTAKLRRYFPEPMDTQ